MRHINIPIFIPQMGCPFQCIFCEQRHISHDGPAPSPSQIDAIIQHCLQTINPAHSKIEVAFFGGSFTALPAVHQQAYLDAVQPFLKEDRVASIRISTRPDFINKDILELLADRGVGTIELGVQSFDDQVLAQSRRGYPAEMALDACLKVKARGFKLGVQLMIGLPGDDLKRDLKSTRMTIEQAADMVRLYPTLVIAGTDLEKLYEAGSYKPLSLEEAVSITKGMFMAFQERQIPVIRMGLHPGEELRQPGNVIAGPFHPAFGELVEQAVFKEQALLLLRENSKLHGWHPSPVLLVNVRDLSKMLGCKRRNIMEIKMTLGLNRLDVAGRPEIPRNEIRLICGEEESAAAVITRKDFLQRR